MNLVYIKSRSSNERNEWCFRPRFCSYKAILGRGQPGLMRRFLLWILPLVQDRSLDLLTSSPSLTREQGTYKQCNCIETCKFCSMMTSYGSLLWHLDIYKCHLLILSMPMVLLKRGEFESTMVHFRHVSVLWRQQCNVITERNEGLLQPWVVY